MGDITGTQIRPDGRRVLASDIPEEDTSPRSTRVEPDTQINAEGVRVPVDSVDPNAPSRSVQGADQRLTAGTDPRNQVTAVVDGDDPNLTAAVTDEGGETGDDGLEDTNVSELREIASDLDIDGRSGMNKDELIAAIRAAEASNA